MIFFRNALNIVKDDLIVKVDELTGEQEILREELLALSNNRVKLRARIQELEDEVRRLKEEQVSLIIILKLFYSKIFFLYK